MAVAAASVLATVAGAQAADLPTRKAAPVQYVKICDAYGAGFFYIPGTDTCLRVGGLVLADAVVSNTGFRANATGPIAIGITGIGPVAIAGGSPVGMNFMTSSARDAVAWGALGRIELDARTQSPWGTVRSFIRVDSYFGSGSTSNTGSLAGVVSAVAPTQVINTVAHPIEARESTILNKAFIQFAGITMGRIQSMFDFYADAATYGGLRGSNQTVNGLAYTATFGGGFSATLSIEDEVSHRQRPTVSSVVTAGGAGVFPANAVNYLGTRMPDIIANLRVDQPWGSAQLSAAVHRVGIGMYNGAAGTPVAPFNSLLAKADSLGFAVQGGVKFNLPMLAPGDNLWLQATYAKGAIGYVSGSNFAFVNGVNTSTGYGVGLQRISAGNGWQEGTADGDCVFTYASSCDKSSAFALTGVFTHYWTPTVKSWLGGSYYQVNYSGNALNPIPTALAAGAGTFNLGVTNYKEFDLIAGLAWNPVRGFEIGTEFYWMHGIASRPVGLPNDHQLIANGFPAWKSQSDLIRGRLRMMRAF
ncbi:MAG: porin [Methylobacteriaceae bacterium]|nr:porin [Methylobacteriaceae bacterium]